MQDHATSTFRAAFDAGFVSVIKLLCEGFALSSFFCCDAEGDLRFNHSSEAEPACDFLKFWELLASRDSNIFFPSEIKPIQLTQGEELKSFAIPLCIGPQLAGWVIAGSSNKSVSFEQLGKSVRQLGDIVSSHINACHTLMDVTEQLTRSYENNILIHNISRALDLDLDLNVSLQIVCEALAESIGANHTALLVPSQGLCEYYSETKTACDKHIALVHRLAGAMPETDEPLVLNNLCGESHWSECQGIIAHVVIAATNLDNERAYIIAMRATGGDAFHTGDLMLLQTILRHAKIIFKNANIIQQRKALEGTLQSKVQERTQELELRKTELEREVSDRMKAEAQLQLAKETAEAATRLKSEFLANMSHEIRTPMNAVIGMSELLLKTPMNDRQKHYACTVRRSAGMLLDLINDILDFSKIEAGKLTLESIDFHLHDEVIEPIMNMLTPLAKERGIEFQTEIDFDSQGWIHADPIRIRQVLLNLTGNALKFTPHGSVVISVLVQQIAGKPTVLFQVKDTGIGIPPERLLSIFEAFTQADGSTSRKYGGTGLGLSISKYLVEMMGGEIGVESQPELGSRFWFRLPLVLTPTPRRCNASAVPAASLFPEPDGNLRVLLVEDNAINRELVCDVLDGIASSIIQAESGTQALSILRTVEFDVILMDCQMPGMDGFEASVRIRKLEGDAKRTPIIALTAHAMPEDRARCLAAGMDDYISKPLDATLLVEKIRLWAKQPIVNNGADPKKITKQIQVRCPGFKSFDYAKTLLRTRNKPELANRLLSAFADQLPDDLIAIQKSWEEKAPHEIARLAHKLKGTAGNLAIESLLHAVENLESANLANRNCALEMEALIAEVQAFLQDIRIVFTKRTTSSPSLTSEVRA